MEILNIRRESGGNIVARFDVQSPWGIRFFGLALKRSPGGWRVYSPSFRGGAVATFDRDVAESLIRAALTAIGEIHHNDNHPR